MTSSPGYLHGNQGDLMLDDLALPCPCFPPEIWGDIALAETLTYFEGCSFQLGDAP